MGWTNGRHSLGAAALNIGNFMSMYCQPGAPWRACAKEFHRNQKFRHT